MDRGFSDEAIVGVKPAADEDAVTYQRVKLLESDSMLEPKGGTWNWHRNLKIAVEGVQP